MAGVCHDDVDFGIFVLASALSRIPRIYLTVWLLDQLGPNVVHILLKRLGRVVLVLLLIVLGIVLWVQVK
jgi:membrane protein DedA with SNARE-associated domain